MTDREKEKAFAEACGGYEVATQADGEPRIIDKKTGEIVSFLTDLNDAADGLRRFCEGRKARYMVTQHFDLSGRVGCIIEEVDTGHEDEWHSEIGARYPECEARVNAVLSAAGRARG